MGNTQHDENLLVVIAVEEYARRHKRMIDGSLFVFHAMPCRQKWLDAANEGGKHGKKTD